MLPIPIRGDGEPRPRKGAGIAMKLPTPTRNLETELAVGSDGTTYITVQGRDERRFVGRKVFVGYALTRHEVARLGPQAIHLWAATALIAWGSDGRIYVHESRLSSTSRRKVFRGFAATEVEAAWITYTLHMTVRSIVSDALYLMRHQGLE